PAPPEYRLPIDDAMRAAPPSAPRVDHIPDLDRRGRNPRRSQFAREGFQTFVRLPLQARNGLVGMLELYNRPLVEWGQDWLDFFDTLGSLTAVAIEHAAATAPSTATLRAGSGAPRPQLSELELDILRLVADGFTNRDIAQQVHRSENTIKFHVRRILERTGASNRTELARRATREGWL
ncbi:MAG TPA: response regulator transcription factor, partial [Candidatus Dormibacteraeota bacterium]|nr:response regulator transcription factor [Candidatus Dormibacteraeota bacterium]